MASREELKRIRANVISRDKRTCQYCGKPKLYGTQLTVDHVHPETEGGEFSEANLVVACKACNHRKGKKPLADYIAHRLQALEREVETLKRLEAT